MSYRFLYKSIYLRMMLMQRFQMVYAKVNVLSGVISMR